MKKKHCRVEGCKEENVSVHIPPKIVTVRDHRLRFISSDVPCCCAHYGGNSIVKLRTVTRDVTPTLADCPAKT